MKCQKILGDDFEADFGGGAAQAVTVQAVAVAMLFGVGDRALHD